MARRTAQVKECTADDKVTSDVVLEEPQYNVLPDEPVGSESEARAWPWNPWILQKNARVRVVIDAVACHDTEDWMGADELYMVGNMAVGLPNGKKVDVPWLSGPAFDCNDGQWKHLDLAVFSEVLPAGTEMEGNLALFDEDFGKDWAKVGPDFMSASKAAADAIAAIGGSKGQMIAQGLNAGMQILNAGAKADKDDLLGLTGFPMTSANPNQSSTQWSMMHVQKTSSWKPNRYEHKVYVHIDVTPTYNTPTLN
ncbi:hypothetical protein [Deinococcus radiotolerans]|uniref:Uncharacterized protein n=1 Tax=Deinococcus radiotolerans TaxID=1309407 RepID=A0ABQ2FP83_9DEIO|nr:hypothetical protein [Deinococcus radiotolerans]GGL13129.1 hypothetical protein GCM10010844_34910 [Deinococcus radiotolerans]